MASLIAQFPRGMLGVMGPLYAALIALVGALGCAGESFEFTGDLGTPVAADVSAAVPVIAVSSPQIGQSSFLVDTGAPLTLADTGRTGLAVGVHDLDLEAFNLEFPALRVASYASALPYDGIIGGDLLAHFAVGVDYRGGRLWLDDQSDEVPAAIAGSPVDEPFAVAATVRGGGVFELPACDACPPIEVGATRFLIDVELEGELEARFLVDTGASAMVLDPAVVESLTATDRPRLDGVTVITAEGPASAAFVRLASVSLGGHAITSVPALVVPDGGFFDLLELEVGREIAGIVGGSVLREFLVTIDYPGRVLRLARYRDRDHIPTDEFIDVGFTMARPGTLWEVEDVYSGTDAAAEGLQSGERVTSIAGTTIDGLDRAAVDALLDGFSLGDEVPVGVVRGAQTVTLDIAVEDLLPSYESP